MNQMNQAQQQQQHQHGLRVHAQSHATMSSPSTMLARDELREEKKNIDQNGDDCVLEERSETQHIQPAQHNHDHHRQPMNNGDIEHMAVDVLPLPPTNALNHMNSGSHSMQQVRVMTHICYNQDHNDR